jgi:hypothetical protein
MLYHFHFLHPSRSFHHAKFMPSRLIFSINLRKFRLSVNIELFTCI